MLDRDDERSGGVVGDEGPAWEPEPLELPLAPPPPRNQTRDEDEPPPGVIVIDLA